MVKTYYFSDGTKISIGFSEKSILPGEPFLLVYLQAMIRFSHGFQLKADSQNPPPVEVTECV